MAEHDRIVNTVVGMVIAIVVIVAVASFVFTQIIKVGSNSTITGNTTVGPFVTILETFLALAFGVGGGVLVLRFLGHGKGD